MNCFLVIAEPLKTRDLLVDFVKFFLSCVYKSPCIILMTTAVCLQEWQANPLGKKKKGEGGRSALNYCIQIYTELSEIIAVTYVSCDGCWHPVLKGVMTVSPSYFCTFLLRQFYQRLPWSEWESSLEHFQEIWVTFFLAMLQYTALHSNGKCIFTVPFAEHGSSGCSAWHQLTPIMHTENSW